MSPSEEKFVKQWELQRRSKMRFIIITALAFGVIVGPLQHLFSILINRQPFDWVVLAINVGVFCVCGTGYAWWMYGYSERRYKRITGKQ